MARQDARHCCALCSRQNLYSSRFLMTWDPDFTGIRAHLFHLQTASSTIAADMTRPPSQRFSNDMQWPSLRSTDDNTKEASKGSHDRQACAIQPPARSQPQRQLLWTYPTGDPEYQAFQRTILRSPQAPRGPQAFPPSVSFRIPWSADHYHIAAPDDSQLAPSAPQATKTGRAGLEYPPLF